MHYPLSQIEEIAMSQELQQLTNKLIDDAENLYGKPLDDWEFSGIEINDRPPSLKYYPETGDVTISLSKKLLTTTPFSVSIFNIRSASFVAKVSAYDILPALRDK